MQITFHFYFSTAISKILPYSKLITNTKELLLFGKAIIVLIILINTIQLLIFDLTSEKDPCFNAAKHGTIIQGEIACKKIPL